ncbi:hypothetical protein BG000_010944 [Podila horticola]|nr:hypothetical protein BG000_010944 [Podila horticola]
MATSKFADHQKFKSKDGTPLVSLRSYPCAADTGERYVLWTDIQHAFRGIDHLETEEGMRIRFTIDTHGELDQRQQVSEESCNISKGADKRGQGDSQSLAHGEIQPSLKDLFETCTDLYQNAKSASNGWREDFRQVAANARYYHSMFKERFERLDKAGADTLVNRKSQEQMLEELRDLEQQLRNIIYIPRLAIRSRLLG